MIPRQILPYLILAFLSLHNLKSAYALSAAYASGVVAGQPACDMPRTAITSLQEAKIGAYNLWDRVSGHSAYQESYMDGYKAGKDLFVLGAKGEQLQLSKIDYRGRITWQVEPKIKLAHIKAIAPHPKGFLVLASQKQSLWLGVFREKDGKQIKQYKIKPVGDEISLAPVDLVAERSGAFLVAANSSGKAGDNSVILYRTDMQGKILQKRALTSSAQEFAHALVAQPRGGKIYLAGQAKSQGGKALGWVAALDMRLDLLWQKTLDRGAAAKLSVAEATNAKAVTFAGWSQAIGSDKKAGWVIRLGGDNGAPIWQRFYTGARNYAATAILGHDEERAISLALSASANVEGGGVKPFAHSLDEPDPSPYVRLLTLDQRGDVQQSEALRNAGSASAEAIISGYNNNRVILGQTYSADAIEGAKSQNSWALAIPAPKPYKALCPWE